MKPDFSLPWAVISQILTKLSSKDLLVFSIALISSPVQSTGRAIVLTFASAFALALPFLSRNF